VPLSPGLVAVCLGFREEAQVNTYREAESYMTFEPIEGFGDARTVILYFMRFIEKYDAPSKVIKFIDLGANQVIRRENYTSNEMLS
jgi:hypothetical protein